MHIRDFVEEDWVAVWPIVRNVIEAQEMFTYDPAMSSDEAQLTWVVQQPGRTVVAVDGGQVVGTAHMQRNRAGPGSHVATASFMVAADARGRGIGSALCQFVLSWARGEGYLGIQFNAVAASNTVALAMYGRFGFDVVGTVPGAFWHPTLGRIGLHVMYCELPNLG